MMNGVPDRSAWPTVPKCEAVVCSGGIGTPTQHRGLLFAQGRVYDVNTLLAPSQQTWQITNVNDVNDDGEMVGSALDGAGVQHAILLTPLP